MTNSCTSSEGPIIIGFQSEVTTESTEDGDLHLDDVLLDDYSDHGMGMTVSQSPKQWLCSTLPDLLDRIGNCRRSILRFCDLLAPARLWTLPICLCQCLLGLVLAYKHENQFGFFRSLFALLTVLAVHSSWIVVDSYSSSVRRFDGRTVGDALLRPSEVVRLGAVLYSGGCLGFFFLLYLTPAQLTQLAFVFFGGLSGLLFFTGSGGLKLVVGGGSQLFLILGPVTTLFTYLAASGTLSTTPCLYSIPLALNAVVILHCNDLRNVKFDHRAGGTASVLDRTRSYVLYLILLYTPFVLVAVFAVIKSRSFFLPLVVAPAFLSLRQEMQEALPLSPEKWDEALSVLPGKTARACCLFGVLFVLSCLAESDGV